MANDKDTVNDAPRIDAGGHIPPAEEKRLFAYYLTADRTEGVPERTAPDHDTEMPLDDAGRVRDFDNDPDTRGGDTGPDRDSDNDTDTVEPSSSVGKARLRRYVVIDKVAPVSQEEIPVDDPDSR